MVGGQNGGWVSKATIVNDGGQSDDQWGLEYWYVMIGVVARTIVEVVISGNWSCD